MNEVHSYNDICPRTGGKEDLCAPNSKYENGTCITTGVLKNMVEAHNLTNPNDIIQLDDSLEILDKGKFRGNIVLEFEKRYGTNQLEWIKKPFISHMEDIKRLKLKKYTFKPDGPQGKFEWLNQLHIDNVMNQYELKYNDFIFLGSVPVDFYEINYNDIAEISIKEDLIDKGKKKIAMIINLDTHDKPGSHWVSLYSFFDVDSNPKKILIYYYDSYGIKPTKRIRKYMRKLAQIAKDLQIEYIDLNYTKRQHQEEDSECGVYSLNFILRLLNGETFQQIESKRVPDKVVNECRSTYFKTKN